ncbi:MAG: site-specific tyrosine recombinase [Acidimicrobiales bacterium]
MGDEPLPAAIEDYLTHLAIEKGRAANTLSAYRRDLRTFVTAIGADRIEYVAPQDVINYHRSLETRGLAASTVNRAMTSIRGMYRYLQAEGVISSDPTADVEPGRLPRGLPRALSEAEITTLLDVVVGTAPAVRRDRSILELLYGTGMRISELVALSLEDLDREAGLILVTGKGDKQRLVPLGRIAADALDAWLSPFGRDAFVPDQWATRAAERAVFLNTRGGRLSRQGVWGVVRKYGLLAGLADRLSPHVLRHSCATHMLDHGADIRTVQELLGHASVSTTQLYTKVSIELLARAYADAHPRAAGRPSASKGASA